MQSMTNTPRQKDEIQISEMPYMSAGVEMLKQAVTDMNQSIDDGCYSSSKVKDSTKGGLKRRKTSIARRKKSAAIFDKDYLKSDNNYFKISLSKDRKSINFENIG